MKKIVNIILLLVFAAGNIANAEDPIRAYEPRYIVDFPTAGMLPAKNYSINTVLVSNGGAVVDFDVTIFDWLNVGIAYGGNGIIGGNPMNMQGLPGFNIKARLLDEKASVPAIVVGFNSQGRGQYLYAQKRYEQLAPDFYAAASKSFKWVLGTFGIHGGINYSVMNEANRGINAFVGIDHSIYKYCAFTLELNPNLNDGQKEIWGENVPVMLNGALHFAGFDNMLIEIQFKDILRNSNLSNQVGRHFGVEFIHSF